MSFSEIPFKALYEVKAYNDEWRIAFRHFYKEAVKDNQIDMSLSDSENLRGLMTIYVPKEKGLHPLVLITHGWGDSKYSFLSIGRHLASNGYAAAVFTSKKNLCRKIGFQPFPLHTN